MKQKLDRRVLLFILGALNILLVVIVLTLLLHRFGDDSDRSKSPAKDGRYIDTKAFKQSAYSPEDVVEKYIELQLLTESVSDWVKLLELKNNPEALRALGGKEPEDDYSYDWTINEVRFYEEDHPVNKGARDYVSNLALNASRIGQVALVEVKVTRDDRSDRTYFYTFLVIEVGDCWYICRETGSNIDKAEDRFSPTLENDD